jgi:hypothetical protein
MNKMEKCLIEIKIQKEEEKNERNFPANMLNVWRDMLMLCCVFAISLCFILLKELISHHHFGEYKKTFSFSII